MNPRALLDTDMQTIGRWLLGGWRWWGDELRALTPPALRPRRAYAAPRFAIEDIAAAKPGMRVTILVPARDCLVRTIIRPAIADRDLRRMIAFEADALLPIPPGSALVTARVAGAADEAGKIEVEVAGLPLDKARAIAGDAAAAGVVPVTVVVAEADPKPAPLDFAPAMREAGLLAPLRSAAPLLWGLVAALLLANVALWIWRDVARVAQFERLVTEQQPAVGIAQTIARRGVQDRRLIARSLALRRVRDPLHALGAVSHALPSGVWLQRLSWDGESVRLVGYRPARTDVATALRRSGGFAEVRSVSEETQAAMPTGEPFDLAAKVVR